MERYCVAAALAVCALACGAAPEDYESIDETMEGDELGSAEEPLVSQINSNAAGNRITGVMWEQSPLNGLTFNAINTLDPSHTWFVPPFKVMTFKLAQNQCSAVQWNRLQPRVIDAVAEMNAALNQYGWAFTFDAQNGKHTIACLDLPVSPVGPNSIRNFVRVQCTEDFVNLVDDQGLPGVATRYDACTIAIDSAAILGYGTTTSNENRVYRHASLHGLEKLVGVGEESGTNGTVSQGTAQQTVTLGLFTSGQLCRTRYYLGAVDSSPTVYGTSTSRGCANN